MDKNLKTHFQIINHILNQHPELLKPIMILVHNKYKESQINSDQSKDIFSSIYRENKWGINSDPASRFFSGDGSHKEHIVTSYVKAISAFVNSLSYKPNALDLGCGDFNIGNQLRYLFNNYIACDIVDDLILYNKSKYFNCNVDFQVLNLVEDKLPSVDIIFIRQVLQHLSNSDISKFVPKLFGNFKWLILTEHVPKDKSFTHNIDQKTGQHIRLSKKSGIVITSPPFNLPVLDEKIICQVEDFNGIIRTIAYRLM